MTTHLFPYHHRIGLHLFLLSSLAEKNEKKHTAEGCSFFDSPCIKIPNAEPHLKEDYLQPKSEDIPEIYKMEMLNNIPNNEIRTVAKQTRRGRPR